MHNNYITYIVAMRPYFSSTSAMGYSIKKGYSGGFRNLERGVQSLASEVHPKIFGLPCPLPVIATDWYLASELFKIAGSPN